MERNAPSKVETIGVERHLLRSEPDGFDTCLGERGEPCCDLHVRQHHRIATREQDLAQLLTPRLGVDATVALDDGVV